MAGTDRVLYLGTTNGLYEATGNGGGYETRLLGLEDKGFVKYPVVDAEDPKRLYAGTMADGMWRSEDGGRTWREINHGLLFKEVFSVAQNDATGELYTGTEPAAIFRSTNGGDSWSELRGIRDLPETIDWTFPRPPHVAHVKHIDVCSQAPDRILGAVEEGWVVRSIDGGKTWKNVKDQVNFDCHTVTTMPDDPNVVLATSGGGFYRSEDGGASFEPAFDGLTHRYMAHVVPNPKRPNLLYTAAAEVPPPSWGRDIGANAAFFRSENRGRSWEQLKGGLPELLRPAPRAVAGDPEDPDAMFVGMMDGSVWMSENGGESFRQIVTGLPAIGNITVRQR